MLLALLLPVRTALAQGTAPSVSAVLLGNPASGTTFGAGETITVYVAFSPNVRVSGRPQLALTIGSATRQATARVGYLVSVSKPPKSDEGVQIRPYLVLSAISDTIYRTRPQTSW